jgi:isopenicillin-N N-acyltransferase like protein
LGRRYDLSLVRNITQTFIQHVYIPGIKEYYPTALEEMRGIAEGAGVSLEDIVMLNARYDLGRSRDPFRRPKNASATADAIPTDRIDIAPEHDDDSNECTSAYFSPKNTANSDAITAQNWDMSAHLYLADTILYLEVHPDPSENLPSLFLVTEAGQMGRSGMNSAGLGVTANSLMSTDDYCPIPYRNADGKFIDFKIRPVLPMSLLRRKFLECTCFAEALIAVNNSPRHVSNNLTVSTSEGFALCLEITPDRIYKVFQDIDDQYLVHTNHFTDPSFHARSDIRDRYPGGSSWYRLQRVELGIRPYRQKKLTEDLIIEAFKDHLSYPESVCQHINPQPDTSSLKYLPGYPYKGPNATVACVLYNLTQKKVKVCKGPPYEGIFQEFHLEGPGFKSKGK